MKHEIIKFYPLQVCYVKHKHDMDHSSNLNFRRKIGPVQEAYFGCIGGYSKGFRGGNISGVFKKDWFL